MPHLQMRESIGGWTERQRMRAPILEWWSEGRKQTNRLGYN